MAHTPSATQANPQSTNPAVISELGADWRMSAVSSSPAPMATTAQALTNAIAGLV